MFNVSKNQNLKLHSFYFALYKLLLHKCFHCQCSHTLHRWTNGKVYVRFHHTTDIPVLVLFQVILFIDTLDEHHCMHCQFNSLSNMESIESHPGVNLFRGFI